MLKGIAGRTAVVTGGAGGIGSATARRLHAEGANVVVVDLDGSGAEAVAAELGSSAVGMRADVSRPEDNAAIVAKAVDTFGSLDMFHINAGVESRVVPIVDFDIEDYRKVFDVNVLGVFLGAQAAVRQMMTQPDRGKIAITASVAGLKSDPGVSVYNASKHAVIGVARSLMKETGALGIRVNVIAPGVVDTRMMRPLEEGIGAMAGVDGAAIQAALNAAVPMGRYGQPEEIAATAAWLLSDEVPYMHGEVVTVAGGLWP